MCICPDLFLWSYQYAQQNVPKSSIALHMKHIKNMNCTTNNHDNFQNKQEYCIWKTIYITNHSKNANHVTNGWKSRWISQFSLKVLHNIITHCSCSLSLLLLQTLVLFLWISVCMIFFFCKMWLFIVLIVMVL